MKKPFVCPALGNDVASRLLRIETILTKDHARLFHLLADHEERLQRHANRIQEQEARLSKLERKVK